MPDAGLSEHTAAAEDPVESWSICYFGEVRIHLAHISIIPHQKKVKEGKENFPDSFFFFLLNKFSASLYNKIHRKETR